jgi:chemotaxis protein histidine kinase CheA
MVLAKTAELSFEYIELLFGDRVKEALIVDLNPLSSVEVMIPDGNGNTARRFLKLDFNRVREDTRISHLLVTVVDVTVQVELEQQLALANQKAKAEMEIMLNVLKVNPATLEQFLKHTEMTLLDINSQLKAIADSTNYRTALNTIFRRIHTLKGEAAALGLEMFENLAQQFEELLAGIRERGEVRGEDLLALPFPLEEFLQRVAMVRSLVERLAAYHDTFSTENDGVFSENLETLAKRIAQDQGKDVQLVTELELLQSIPQKTRSQIKDITLQLLRNAVSHGIEPATERTQFAKAAWGNIHIALKLTPMGEYELTLRDDGRGLVPQRIRSALLHSRRYSKAQLNELSDQQIIMKIFESGFSTAGQATKDAGHGVGMDVVKDKVQQIGAKLRISSRENAFTQFSIQFAA